MLKKIIIPVVVFVASSLVAFNSGKKQRLDTSTKEVSMEESFDPSIVLELFTSQGCSSCPPADALLEKVKKQFPDGVYALSYHVDYWNYIGWKDPFSKSVFTKKQTAYNRKFRNRSNYTPQLVINGQEHFVGSSHSKMYTKIKEYKLQKAENEISVHSKGKDENTLKFKYSIAGDMDSKILRVVLVLDERTTSVTRGENRNRVLKNSNIVVNEKYVLAPNKEGTGSITIPPIITPKDKLTLMVLVETDELDITAAAKIPFEG